MKLLSVNEAAAQLGLSDSRVRRLCREGKIYARKIGRAFVIPSSSLDSVRVYGKAGRPKKSAENSCASP